MSVKKQNKSEAPVTYGRFYRFYVLHNLENFHIALIALAGILYLISKFSRNHIFADAGLWVLYFSILSFLIHLNQRKLYQYMSVNDKVAYLPVRQIRMMNNLFLSVFVIASGILMFVLPRTHYQKISSTIAAFFKALISYILHFFFRDTEYEGLGKILKADINYAKGSLPQSSDTFWDRFLKIFEKFMGVIAVVLLVVLLFALVTWLYRKFVNREQNDSLDEHEFITTAMKKEKLKKKKEAANIPGFFDTDVNSRVRKLYRRTIQKHISFNGIHLKKDRKRPSRKTKTLAFYTPHEIERYVNLPESSQSEYLHICYEKARYSQSGCTQEDFTKLKKGDSNGIY